jgi:glycosyltransferase involved in cell wall biosynthesis
VLVFTLDEEINLPYCLESLQWCDDIIVVDSGSRDATVSIAEAAGARVFYRAFDGFGSQRNWAIKNTHPKHDWLFILDADERFCTGLAKEANALAANADSSIGAARVRRRFHLWGKWLRHSSMYPTWVVRMAHKDRIEYVNRGHGETQNVRGKTIALENDLIDENHRGLDHWYARQQRYALNDAAYELDNASVGLSTGELVAADPLVRKMALKRISWRLPFRPSIYFIYSYLLSGGFLDGIAGYRFCIMRSRYQAMIVKNKTRLKKARNLGESNPA